MWRLRLAAHSGSACRSCASRAGSCSRLPRFIRATTCWKLAKRGLSRSSGCGEVILAPGEYPGAARGTMSRPGKACDSCAACHAADYSYAARAAGSRSDPRAVAGTPGQRTGSAFPLDNRPHRELGVAVALIGLAAAPGAAQLQPRQTIVSPEGLGNISGMVHCFGLCCGDKPFIACCAEAVARLDLRTASKKDVTLAVRGNMFS